MQRIKFHKAIALVKFGLVLVDRDLHRILARDQAKASLQAFFTSTRFDFPIFRVDYHIDLRLKLI